MNPPANDTPEPRRLAHSPWLKPVRAWGQTEPIYAAKCGWQTVACSSIVHFLFPEIKHYRGSRRIRFVAYDQPTDGALRVIRARYGDPAVRIEGCDGNGGYWIVTPDAQRLMDRRLRDHMSFWLAVEVQHQPRIKESA
ncbi:MAG: hypothetical protein ACOC93_02190 [Planctomycetota bacterium]